MNDKFKIMAEGKGENISNLEINGNVRELHAVMPTVVCKIADQTDTPATDLIDDIKEALQCARLQ